VRPHDVSIELEPSEGRIEAMIDHVLHLGFEVRVELTLHDGDRLSVQTTRDEADQLELVEGQIVWLRPARTTRFDEHEPQEPEEAVA
jgi:sulfate transport system ATP-binding protein